MNKLPNVIKTLTCLVCGTDTEQCLQVTKSGCGFFCQKCNHLSKSFSLDEMARTVQKQVFKIDTSPSTVETPNWRVFIKRHGIEVEEAEVSSDAIREHIDITGCLPVVGKPLFTSPLRGNKLFAIPYGKVVRIET